jgi:hypothetical protein
MADLVPFNADTDPLTGLLLRAAADTAFDVQKFESVIRFLGEREAKQNERAFNAAMSRAQSELRGVLRDRKNTHLGTRYATLDSMLSVVLPPANANGLSIRFEPEAHPEPNMMRMAIVISHDDGHVSRRTMDGPVTSVGSQGGRSQMTPMQTVGSAATYLCRYLVRAAFALQVTDDTEDDDGEASRQQRQPDTRPSTRETPAAGAEPAKKSMTTREWLENLRVEIVSCTSAAMRDAILARGDVSTADGKLTGEAQSQFRRMVAQAKQMHWPDAAKAAPEPVEDPPALVGLLARIENATEAELNEMPTTPSFNEAMIGLTFPQQDRIDQAVKERGALLDKLKAEASNA